MKQIEFTVFPSLFETGITEQSTKNAPWEALAKKLQQPVAIEDKSKGKMFSGATFKEGGRRCNDDIIEHHLLVLDIDEGWHPLMFIEQFKDKEFLLYTSYNHRWDGEKLNKDVMKFRAVFPLAKPVTPEHFKRMKAVLMEHFDGVDPASFVASQAFFLPSHHPDRATLFKAVHNKGEMFDFDQFQLELFIQQQKALYQNKRSENNRSDDRLTPINEAVELLKGMSSDVEYSIWWKVGACLKNLYGENGFKLWLDWSAKGQTFDGSETKLQSKWNGFNETSNYTYGYLVNRSREYPI